MDARSMELRLCKASAESTVGEEGTVLGLGMCQKGMQEKGFVNAVALDPDELSEFKKDVCNLYCMVRRQSAWMEK